MTIEGTIPFYDDPEGESTIFLGVSGQPPVLLSTAATVTSKVKNAFDKQRPKAKSFGRKKFLGSEPAEFSVDFLVYPEDEATFKKDVLPLLRSKKKSGDAPPLDARCSQINMWGVNTVTIISASVGHPDPAEGRSVSIELEEWTPAPVAPKKTATAKDKSFTNAVDSYEDRTAQNQ
jgi:hypothetical protein